MPNLLIFITRSHIRRIRDRHTHCSVRILMPVSKTTARASFLRQPSVSRNLSTIRSRARSVAESRLLPQYLPKRTRKRQMLSRTSLRENHPLKQWRQDLSSHRMLLQRLIQLQRQLLKHSRSLLLLIRDLPQPQRQLLKLLRKRMMNPSPLFLRLH